eukprot:TRINITY_DN17998_c0_g1_i1.p1 TRINITY_DN17998_c0_g1~~TRINITY_DN17998_c0_g1_i1.p1  ORF type:complete len:764 (-),score=139.82 TRINITY_DN17998_c0_g1_i1:116-2407(-)
MSNSFHAFLMDELHMLHARVVAEYDRVQGKTQNGDVQHVVDGIMVNQNHQPTKLQTALTQRDSLQSENDALRQTLVAMSLAASSKVPNQKPSNADDVEILDTALARRILPTGGQDKFASHREWVEEAWEAKHTLRRVRSNLLELRSNMSNQLSDVLKVQTPVEATWNAFIPEKFILDPSAKQRLFWDMFGICLILYDMIMLPFAVFGPNMPMTALIFSWLARVFWTCDIPASFLLGFYHGGVLILSPWRIAKRYITTWFLFDILLVSIEWAQLADPEEEGTDDTGGLESLGLARMGKTFRILRILRILRLLRLMKLPKLFMLIEERIQSESVSVVISITKLTVSILVVNHFIACLWYLLGVVHVGDDSWTVFFDARGTSVGNRYAMSLHWSLTQFTPSTMEVFPQNESERAFAVVVVVFAMIVFSSFISSITTAMNQLRNLNSENAKSLLIFQRYLRHHKISTPLVVRMRRHLERKLLRVKGSVEEKDVELINQLSLPLLMDLHLEIFRPALSEHPFFPLYEEENSMSMRKLCHCGISEFSVSAGDTIFACGEVASKMIFVKSGILKYFRGEDDSDSHFLKRNDWAAEACLWTKWRHLGNASSAVSSTLTSVDASKFLEIVACAGFLGRFNPACYARLFVEHLNSMDDDDLTDTSMMGFDYDKACRISMGTGDDDIRLPGSSAASESGVEEPPSPTSPWTPSALEGKRASSKGSLPSLRVSFETQDDNAHQATQDGVVSEVPSEPMEVSPGKGSRNGQLIVTL